ncbi:MAG: SDR family oxidoreductase [Lachnospiraceae bacterium]|nr:SDR family oxidoreductase [Lachnospiraceae bacterium]
MIRRKKYAVITGASAGIGLEFAKRLAGRGYPLVLIARRQDRLNKIAKELKTKCEIIVADLSREEECYRVFYQLQDKEVGVFINNAGFGDCGRFAETDLQKEMNMVQVNVKAMHVLMKLMLQKMQKKDYGYILNVASSAGLMPAGPYMATYYATKAYVASLTQAVAEELRESGSRVYVGCLCPGPVDTEFNSVANVEFALKGITPQYCVDYALKQMGKKEVVIVPTKTMQFAMTFGRFLPRSVYVRIAAHQQKKKFQNKN